jgi:hypothetical protein
MAVATQQQWRKEGLSFLWIVTFTNEPETGQSGLACHSE